MRAFPDGSRDAANLLTFYPYESILRPPYASLYLIHKTFYLKPERMTPTGRRLITWTARVGCLSMLLAAVPASAEAPAGIWVTAEGMSPFQRDLSLDEVRGKARDEARRNAIEQAVGLFVRGTTILHNAQIADELIASVARGIIEEEEWLDERIEEVSEKRSGPKFPIWRSKVKARVRPVHVERRAGFDLRASLNKTVFQEGEEALIKVRSSQQAYIHLFSVTQDGAVTLLLPNRFLTDNRFEANEDYVMPNERLRTLGVKLRVMLPKDARKAVEYIKVIATRKPISLVSDKSPDGVFHTFDGTETGMIKDVVRRLAQLDDEDWTEATLPYEVRK